jgi:hypothetical protein
MCCAVRLIYPSYVAGILDVVEEIHFYVLCNNTIICAEYLEQALFNEECTISSISCDKNYFMLLSNGETVILKFDIRILEGKLPFVLTFTYDLIRNSHLSTLAFAIVCVNNRITCVTDEVLASKYDCMYKEYETY